VQLTGTPLEHGVVYTLFVASDGKSSLMLVSADAAVAQNQAK